LVVGLGSVYYLMHAKRLGKKTTLQLLHPPGAFSGTHIYIGPMDQDEIINKIISFLNNLRA